MTGFKCYPRAKSQNICKYVFPHSTKANQRQLKAVNTVKPQRFKTVLSPISDNYLKFN